MTQAAAEIVPLIASQRPSNSLGSRLLPSHSSNAEYEAFVAQLGCTPEWQARLLRFRRQFVARYPDLTVWFDRPLRERAGWRGRERQIRRRAPYDGFNGIAGRINHEARPYLIYLGFTGRLCLDWGWLFGVGVLKTWAIADGLGLPLGGQVDRLLRRSIELGLRNADVRQRVHWAIPRMLLRRGISDLNQITLDDVNELRTALHDIKSIPEIDQVLPTGVIDTSPRVWATYAFQTGVALYHAGITDALPQRQRSKPLQRVNTVPAIEAVMNRYLNERALIDRPSSVGQTRAGLLRLSAWLTETRPHVQSLAELTRDDLVDFLTWLRRQHKLRHPDRPLSPAYQRMVIHQVTSFFRNTAQAGWDGVPVRSPLITKDVPKTVQRVPRFIPDDQLEPLMRAIRELQCPLQRCALLVARWSGARRGEIRRLHLDCLSAYPDGSPRLRLAAGKSRKERVVPIHPEAADAIRTVIETRRQQPDRGLPDPDLGREVRYLFLQHGCLASADYLFTRGLEIACERCGLLSPEGKREVHAHRFRHTLGTQLGERGARIQTIMKLLGHLSASMSMTYTALSDPVVLADYQSVLKPGAVLAGAQAQAIRSGELTEEAVNWLKTNFYKTELELGRCLRLPQEGPCECDLYLTCSKFVTTPQYIPRLEDRLRTEEQLIADAADRGWAREIERHRCTADRIRRLLDELGLAAPAS